MASVAYSFQNVFSVPAKAEQDVRAIQQKSNGSSQSEAEISRVDVRFIAATNQDLAALIANKRFRMDLYYRLNVFAMTPPTVRLCMDDIPMLVAHFVHKFGERTSKRILKIPKRAMHTLVRFSRTPIREIRGIHGIRAIHGSETAILSLCSFIFMNLEMAGAMQTLGEIVRWHDVIAATGDGKQGRSEGDGFPGFAESRRRIEADFSCAEVDLLRDSHSSDQSALPDARSPLGGVTSPDLEAKGIEGLNRKRTMSCRIDRVVSSENLVVLFLSGRITGEHVDMLRGVLEQESGGFAIDLKNVLLVDREAVKLLALSEANGTELRNCPPYIREWVTRDRAEGPERPSEQGLEGREDIEDV